MVTAIFSNSRGIPIPEINKLEFEFEISKLSNNCSNYLQSIDGAWVLWVGRVKNVCFD